MLMNNFVTCLSVDAACHLFVECHLDKHIFLLYFRETEVDKFKDFVRNMDDGTKKLIEIGESNWDKVSKCKL